jgi:hypothetical protein
LANVQYRENIILLNKKKGISLKEKKLNILSINDKKKLKKKKYLKETSHKFKIYTLAE